MKGKVVYINARFLTQPISGVQRFAIEISKELKKSGFPIVFLSPKNILHKELADELEVKVLGVLKGHLWEQIELQAYVMIKNGFLISFCNTAPIFLKNQIVTVHDLCFRIYPNWFSKSFSMIYNFMIPKICHNAKAIITVSESSKNELYTELGISKEKITVVYNAIASVFNEIEPFNRKNTSPMKNEYILTVSSHHPRKNFKRLIEAFKLVNKPNLKLCILGKMNNNFGKTKLLEDENIHYLENIDDDELKNYYKFSKLFVFPSVYEGFGIPIIEAIKFGVPVCVSDIPVFHEICKTNAIYFNPLDINDIKNKIIGSLEMPIKTDDVDLSQFSWERGASKIIKLIEENSKVNLYYK